MAGGVARLGPRLLLLPAGTALGIVLLILLLRAVNLNQLGASFTDVDYLYLALSLPFFAINLLVKVPRWSLLYGEDTPDWDTLFGAINVGYAVNTLLPLRLGDIIRAYWVRERVGLGMVRSLSTIALERVLDGVTLVVFFLLTVPTVAFPRQLLAPALLIGALFMIALLAMVILAYGATREDHPLSRLLDRLEQGRTQPAGRILRHVVTGLQALRSRRAIALILLYTLIIWGSNALFVWLVVRAFHIAVPLTAGVLLVSVLNLGMAVPSSPGYIGQFEALMVLTLGLYAVHRAPALAAAFALHALAFVPVTIIGLVYIARMGLQVTLQMVRASATRTG